MQNKAGVLNRKIREEYFDPSKKYCFIEKATPMCY